MSSARRILVVGCEGADWASVHRLSAAGALPNLHDLIEDGASGSLRAPPPPLAEMLWTSLATGCRPRRHGVTSPSELRPDGGGVQPTGRRSWRHPAFWEELAQDGLATCIVNWPATWPAAYWPGTLVDERFARAAGKDFEGWPLPPDCVAPPSLRATLRELRVHPADVSEDEIAVFAPDLPPAIPAGDERAVRIATMVAETATVHAAATHLMTELRWDLLAVRYDLIAQAQAAFPPREPAQSNAGLDAAYRFLDMMLGRLIELCDDATDVVVVSPRGPAGPGILAARGPTIARDRIVHGAAIFDVAPTILALFGRASGGTQDGRVLDDLLLSPSQSLQRLRETHVVQNAPGEDPTAHLRALGYSDAPTPAQLQAMREAELSSLLHLAESDIALGAYREAAATAERALALVPQSVPAALLLAHARVSLDEWEACAPIADLLLARQPDAPWGSLLKGAVLALASAIQAAEPHLARARALARDMPLAHLALGLLALRLRNIDDASEHFRAALARQPDLLPALRGLASVLRARREFGEAEELLRQAITLRYIFPEVHYQLGLVLAEQGRIAEATHALRTALRQNPDLSEADAALQRIVQAQIARGQGRAQ